MHAADAATVSAEFGFDACPVTAQRGDAGHAGDDYTSAAHQHSPPLTAMTCRVIYAASADMRKFTAPATSSGVPLRCAGTIFSISSMGSSASSIAVSISQIGRASCRERVGKYV